MRDTYLKNNLESFKLENNIIKIDKDIVLV